MLKLYITRHGETEWNVQRRMQGWKNSNLTQNGINAAEALGERLKNIDLNVIYSSSSQRAIHTAELIRGDRKIEIITDDNLREMNLAEWEGKAYDEFDPSDDERRYNFWNKPHLFVEKGGENFFQVRTRIEGVLKRITEENADCSVLIVTHGIIVKTIMSIFKNIPVDLIWEQPYIEGTSLSIVEIGNDVTKVLLEGDTAHLK